MSDTNIRWQSQLEYLEVIQELIAITYPLLNSKKLNMSYKPEPDLYKHD